MLPVERQKQIQKLIKEKKTLKINELSEYFNVSEMTIYRDIKPLVEEGLVAKNFGGISLVENNKQTFSYQSHCVYCHKPNNTKIAYRLILPNDKVETACCAHCGLLRHRQIGEEVLQAICHDFFVNTTISASLTWYVMDTSLNVACCQPQVLTFEQREHAEKFIKGFGGDIYRFEDAMEVVYQKMQGYSGCCNNHK
ncbi:DeoR family transcriptional regulator [Alteribacillus bidgolensis]|uniref:DNA-binding transcriptional regulator of sugar metabolism, DeoR/GlpR family n=1 Tax=Alteribacillus bidgolensis TaxID=930129 RepID=A0A1G8PZP3_9BACI|nr:DeoR family transcriptional regulator [Alteribacillus bidgolensis]SDI97858.1 DNA-binding transcriptional regulator of sugar metabolism, DeoR/GlpR family [Alteribacillus bidgolensis]